MQATGWLPLTVTLRKVKGGGSSESESKNWMPVYLKQEYLKQACYSELRKKPECLKQEHCSAR